jgi:hypothetical protein
MTLTQGVPRGGGYGQAEVDFGDGADGRQDAAPALVGQWRHHTPRAQPGAARQGEALQVDPIKLNLKPPGTERVETKV